MSIMYCVKTKSKNTTSTKLLLLISLKLDNHKITRIETFTAIGLFNLTVVKYGDISKLKVTSLFKHCG